MHDLFSVCSNHTTFKLQCNLQVTFLTHLDLETGQGHQTYNDKVDPRQGNNQAKFERSCFNGVREKPIHLFFVGFLNLRKYVNYLIE